MRTYTLKDVAAKTGIAARTVIDWAEKKIVRPDVADTSGSGTPRQYSDVNLLEFMIAKELVALGFPVQRAKRLLDRVKDETPALWSDLAAVLLGVAPSGAIYVLKLVPAGEEPWEHLHAANLRKRLARHGEGTFVLLNVEAYRQRLVKT